ncbi:hypothetical protein GCM10022226_62230 [Sphaerisporangium flaviroseum]|uniref:Uncharacterized protein n=1 Tax=Sphaerisporangium flaviroseum TaxID=509199 RepID=A0ABP7J1T7_9ACTN
MSHPINAGNVAGARAHPTHGLTFGLALLAHVGFTGYLMFLGHPLWESLAGSTSAVLVAAYVTRVVLTGVPHLAFTARSLVARTVLSWVKQGVAEQLPATQPSKDQQPSSVQGEVIA